MRLLKMQKTYLNLTYPKNTSIISMTYNIGTIEWEYFLYAKSFKNSFSAL